MSGNYSGIRLSWYVILSQMCFFTLVILFVIASIHVNKLILADIIIGSSNDIFQKETLLELKQIWIHQYHSQHLFENTFGTLQRINYIQQLVSNSQRFTIQQPIECLKSYAVDSYCYNASMCYGIFDNLETIYQQEVLSTIFNVTSVLTEYRYAMLLEEKTPIFYTYDSDAQFFACTNENFVYPPNYLPHSRPWYTEFQKSSNKERVFGLPYQIPSGEVRVPIMRGLMANNGSYCGVISEHIDLVKEIKLLLTLDKVLYILNKEGLVVFGKQYLNVGQKVFSIFNTSLTGFDIDDWTEILAFLKGEKFNNLCDKRYDYPNIMCRYNHLEESDVLIQIMKITDSPYFLLFYQQDQNIRKQKNDLVNIITNTMQQIETGYYQVISCCITIVVIITQLLMTATLKQTKLLIEYTYANVKVHSLKIIQQKIKKQLVNLWIQSSTVTKLYEAADKWYNYLTKGSNNKNTICEELEKEEYPINTESISNDIVTSKIMSELADEVCFEDKSVLSVSSLRQIAQYCLHKRRINFKFYFRK